MTLLQAGDCLRAPSQVRRADPHHGRGIKSPVGRRVITALELESLVPLHRLLRRPVLRRDTRLSGQETPPQRILESICTDICTKHLKNIAFFT